MNEQTWRPHGGRLLSVLRHKEEDRAHGTDEKKCWELVTNNIPSWLSSYRPVSVPCSPKNPHRFTQPWQTTWKNGPTVPTLQAPGCKAWCGQESLGPSSHPTFSLAPSHLRENRAWFSIDGVIPYKMVCRRVSGLAVNIPTSRMACCYFYSCR